MSDPKRCPFIKETFLSEASGTRWDSPGACLQDKCAMWRLTGYFPAHVQTEEQDTAVAHDSPEPTQEGYCGLAGRP